MDDLATCLRAWRERLTPSAAGLPSSGRRRTPGLRRQEVAQLAGVSVEYLARLEQGRAAHPSASVIDPLARALGLSDAEHDHLLMLAGHAPRNAAKPRLTPGLQRILSRLEDTPVHVSDETFDHIYANDLAKALLGEQYFTPGSNAARQEFLGPPTRVLDEDDHHTNFRARIVGNLRSALSASAQRERVRTLVDELIEASPDFAQRWAQADIEVPTNRRKAIMHPELGRIEVDCDRLRVDDSSLSVVVYTTPEGTPDARALALLSAPRVESST